MIDSKWLKQKFKETDASQSDLARHLGFDDASKVNKMLSGTRKVQANEVQPILEFFGDTSGNDMPAVPTIDDFRMIGSYDIRASAGPGAIMIDGSEAIPERYHPFEAEWLRTITSASDMNLAVIRASGDSMEPVLRDGDLMLIDRGSTELRRPGIYVIGFDGILNVKRVSVNELERTIRISSDNPAYSSYDATMDDSIDVAGQVIWIGRKV